MDKIYIENLEFIGNHGVFPEEKFLEQKFIISVEMSTSTRRAGCNDDLNYSTHYGFVSNDIEEVFYSKSFDLIEALAEKIAEKILINYHFVKSIKVTVKKPWAPIKKHFDYVAVEINRSKNKAYLSIGTNMGNKKENLNLAIEKINSLPNTKISKISSFIETEPFGDVVQDNFLNACLELETLSTAPELLDSLIQIEKEMGRVREIKWGPRLIDLDILLFNDEIHETDELAIPHPWMCEREFVLQPLSEIAPNFIHPLEKKTISTLKRLIEK
ncbi:2-amino-4-hydroxy-6-hydroxymethyldihydropteridine diphosphokinase [Cetobacterium sp. 2A]|uniref:2-amino-4-hydroxy-6- hydroxymethyldihydropteridine diphosphokinase n=1 Tax=Cetobacterium sp. 2A TaxID=2754723 RepID=UPI00163D39D4|nr:2-amino-4-hydroxy-6-hydroxymethyldihydropteridine diphosphokinase [Cetobacterium sp. 2A]MBC2854915.1 2-amino-4-hydroxy-6-hydroxymethyldihydropteridine diphosphokinase [Cetobacterium sp. 2A]